MPEFKPNEKPITTMNNFFNSLGESKRLGCNVNEENGILNMKCKLISKNNEKDISNAKVRKLKSGGYLIILKPQ